MMNESYRYYHRVSRAPYLSNDRMSVYSVASKSECWFRIKLLASFEPGTHPIIQPLCSATFISHISREKGQGGRNNHYEMQLQVAQGSEHPRCALHRAKFSLATVSGCSYILH